MQVCTRCNASSPDSAMNCETCQSDLREWSDASVALRTIEANPRAKLVRVAVTADSCPACSEIYGAYQKGHAPHLPVEGCSNRYGCRCFYEPILDEVFP